MVDRNQGEAEVPDVTPELPGATWRLVLGMLRFLPQASLSRSLGHLADLRLPRALRQPVLGRIARALRIDLAEAERPLDEYASLNELFVRRLRPGLRPVPADPRLAVSPVDGVIGQFGAVRDGRAIQAKGRSYSVGALLGDEALGARYTAGSFLTIYLSPRHYHRIHSPVSGRVVRARHVPGALWPVNDAAVKHVPDLFPRNERLIAYVESGLGLTAVVAVGAYNVGRISAVFDAEWRAPGWASNRRGAAGGERVYGEPLMVQKGEELMAFHLGSTIVLLFEAGVRLAPDLAAGHEIRIGADVAYATGA